MPRVKKVLLLAEICASDDHPKDEIPALWRIQNQTLLAWQMNRITQSGREVVLALGPNGDDVLRATPDLDNCDLVYDPNSKPDLISSMQAGLRAADSAVYVLPINVPFPGEEALSQLENHFWGLTDRDQIDMVRVQVGSSFGFPLLISRSGLFTLRKSPRVNQLNEIPQLRLEILRLPSNWSTQDIKTLSDFEKARI